MSLYAKLSFNIDGVINEFVDLIANKYNLNKNELMGLWRDEKGEENKQEAKVKPKKEEKKALSIDTQDLSLSRLMNLTKPEIIALCKEHNHKTTGTKQQLIDRLVNNKNDDSKEEKEEGEKEKEIKEPTKKGKKVLSPTAEIIRKIIGTNKPIAIRTNKYGHSVHPETNLVFNPDTQEVIGKENNGTIDELTDEDIDICKLHKFSYKLPKNLKGINIVKMFDVVNLDFSDLERCVF